MILDSKPTLSGFSPNFIPYQRDVCDLVRDFDYSQANLEILLSGGFGSAKTTLIAHLVVRHCCENKGARAAVGRRGMPDLKRTIWRDILEHISEDLIEGRDYWLNRTEMCLKFKNGSEIIAVSWSDRLYKKFRSLKLSMLVIEEMVENDEQDEEAFKQLRARLRRLPHVKQNLFIGGTNPDAPTHWVYKYFIEPNLGETTIPNRFVFYSKTYENPFLDPTYAAQLRKDLTPKEALRYLESQWVEIAGEVIYCEYDRDVQYKPHAYTVNPREPVILSWDFNIGHGKPMSMCCLQFIDGIFHIFDEVVIDGARTADTLDELDSKGLLKKEWRYKVSGDAAGKHRDTRSSRSDYDIITKELQNRGLTFDYCVPAANPPVRLRHNRVNAYCKNADGEVRLFVYKDAKTVDEGLRMVKLKTKGQYIEDDSKRFQHVTTAVGYAVVYESIIANRRPQGTIQL